MTLRVLALAALFPLASFCQIQLFLFDGTNETAITSSGLSVGAVAVGDSIETDFHIRNTGATSATITTITLAGSGFTLTALPNPQYVLAPGAFVGFSTTFTASVAATYSAILAINSPINSLTVTLRASATPASAGASVYLDGSTISLASGATIGFGSVTAGSTGSHSITVDNTNGTSAASIAISGAGFQASSAPAQVAVGATATFTLSFQPPSGQAYQGTLSVGQQSFILQGQGITAAAPTASIVVNNGASVSSAQQVYVTIPLGAASQAIATGTLTLQFQAAASGATDDPAIQFLTGSARTAGVTVLPGDTTARINGNPSIAMQTGTTAGSIVLALQLGSAGSQVSIPIPPTPVLIETEGGVVSQSELTISMSGFDNTHSASQLVFTFYDTNNNTVSPGSITMDATSIFQNYFNGSAYGGLFSLNAAFPVTGNITLISTAQVALTNSAGVTQTQRIVF
jgi:hypothetical protein